MAKMIRHDFGSILMELNAMIVAEVKAALELLPGKAMESGANRVPLCRIVVSGTEEYLPIGISVRRVWIDDDDTLCFSEYEARYNSPMNWDEYDDLLDITDFAHLIDQIAKQVEGDATYNLPDRSITVFGYVTEYALKRDVEKTVTV